MIIPAFDDRFPCCALQQQQRRSNLRRKNHAKSTRSRDADGSMAGQNRAADQTSPGHLITQTTASHTNMSSPLGACTHDDAEKALPRANNWSRLPPIRRPLTMCPCRPTVAAPRSHARPRRRRGEYWIASATGATPCPWILFVALVTLPLPRLHDARTVEICRAGHDCRRACISDNPSPAVAAISPRPAAHLVKKYQRPCPNPARGGRFQLAAA